jgi:hypothetical protein
MWTTSVIFNKLLKVIIRPLSENSPNLATLLCMAGHLQRAVPNEP